MRQQGHKLMNESFQSRLGSIVSGRIPAGSSDCRTLGLVLLHELLEEIRAVRSLLEFAPVEIGTVPEVESPPAVLPVNLASASASAVCEMVSACDDLSVLNEIHGSEGKRSKPRKTVLKAIARRVQTLVEAHDVQL
jgi:hypothetical protein